MITYKTTTEFPIPTSRGIKMGIIYLTVERIEIDINNILPIGYYYYIDEANNIIKIDDITKKPKLWIEVIEVEDNMLPALESNNLKYNILQRLREFTEIQMILESGENFGTTPEDWEIVI